MREKLIELLERKYDHYCDQCGINKQSDYIDNLADYLIDHGVNVCTSGEYLPREETIKGVLEQMQASTHPKCMEEFLRNLNGVTVTDNNVGGKKPITNGGRIRAMTDEKLGDWLCSIMANCDEKCPGSSLCKTGHMGTIAWLKQPVEEET